MKTIDKYVYAVTEKLPENIRDDIKKELYANIEDMLSENPSEDDIRRVLEGLGNPVTLAHEYNQIKRYLIGPDIYDNYISVLKLVTGIVAIALAIVTLLGEVVNPSISEGLVQMSINVSTKLIGSVIEGIFQGFLWVTFVFVIIERTGVNDGKIPFIKKKWSIDDLPEVPVSNRRKISRVETAFGMFFIMLFLIIFYFQPETIGMYSAGKNGITLIEPLLMINRLQYYMPVIIITAFLGFGIQIWKFISMQWSLPLAIANTINNLVVCILLFVMIGDASLINQNFIPSFTDVTKFSLSNLNDSWYVSARVFIGIFVIISLWDSVSGFIKCKK